MLRGTGNDFLDLHLPHISENSPASDLEIQRFPVSSVERHRKLSSGTELLPNLSCSEMSLWRHVPCSAEQVENSVMHRTFTT